MPVPPSFNRLGRRLERVSEVSQKRTQRDNRRNDQAAKDRERERGVQISVERELGRIARLIGLTALPLQEIRGAMYSLEQGVGEEKTRAQWLRKDAERQTQEAAAREASRENCILKFPSTTVLTAQEKDILEKAGMKLSPVWGWRSKASGAVLDEVRAIARLHEGVISRPDGTVIEEPDAEALAPAAE